MKLSVKVSGKGVHLHWESSAIDVESLVEAYVSSDDPVSLIDEDFVYEFPELSEPAVLRYEISLFYGERVISLMTAETLVLNAFMGEGILEKLVKEAMEVGGALGSSLVECLEEFPELVKEWK